MKELKKMNWEGLEKMQVEGTQSKIPVMLSVVWSM